MLPGLSRPVFAAIFDCDGTLADTMPLHYSAWRKALERYEAEMSEELFYELAGVPTVEIVRILNSRQGRRLDPHRVAEEKEALYETLIPQIRGIEPVTRIVHALHGRCPMAVASGGLRRLVERTLAALRLADRFVAVCTAEDVERGKPAPDLFLLAADRLGAQPAFCVVYEDSDLGLEAARRAGMMPVDVRPWLAAWKGEELRERR
jgi:beta-phosphoglucomutase family hydrolase